jgi:hypothetical protein
MSGKQSQGGSQKDKGDMKQSGAGTVARDKHASDAGEKSGESK